TLVRIDQFGLVLEFPSEVIEAWLEADAFGKQYEAVTSKARLAAGYLDHAEVVRCVASPEEGGLEARLPDLDREPAGGVVERLRFLEILDPDVGVAEAARFKDLAGPGPFRSRRAHDCLLSHPD